MYRDREHNFANDSDAKQFQNWHCGEEWIPMHQRLPARHFRSLFIVPQFFFQISRLRSLERIRPSLFQLCEDF
jgi:hypothetical protein